MCVLKCRESTAEEGSQGGLALPNFQTLLYFYVFNKMGKFSSNTVCVRASPFSGLAP